MENEINIILNKNELLILINCLWKEIYVIDSLYPNKFTRLKDKLSMYLIGNDNDQKES